MTDNALMAAIGAITVAAWLSMRWDQRTGRTKWANTYSPLISWVSLAMGHFYWRVSRSELDRASSDTIAFHAVVS